MKGSFGKSELQWHGPVIVLKLATWFIGNVAREKNKYEIKNKLINNKITGRPRKKKWVSVGPQGYMYTWQLDMRRRPAVVAGTFAALPHVRTSLLHVRR